MLELQSCLSLYVVSQKQLAQFPTQTLVLRLEKEKEDAVTVTNELKRENADLQQVSRDGGRRLPVYRAGPAPQALGSPLALPWPQCLPNTTIDYCF